MKCPMAVLLVDDDRDLARGASLRLKAAGYHTHIAYDGSEGVKAARSVHPDAIVLDVRMPVMDGLKALNHLRHYRGTSDIPVVMLSASLVDQQAALDAGARYFLTKPYQSATLVTAVGKAIAENQK